MGRPTGSYVVSIQVICFHDVWNAFDCKGIFEFPWTVILASVYSLCSLWAACIEKRLFDSSGLKSQSLACTSRLLPNVSFSWFFSNSMQSFNVFTVEIWFWWAQFMDSVNNFFFVGFWCLLFVWKCVKHIRELGSNVNFVFRQTSYLIKLLVVYVIWFANICWMWWGKADSWVV